MRFDLRKILLMSSALTGTLALSPSNVSAATATFTNNIGAAGSPSTIDGAFDISGFVEAQQSAGNAVTINSATVQIYGYSQAHNTYVSTYLGQYVAGYYTYTYYYSSCGTWGCSYYPATGYAAYYGALYHVDQGDFQADTVLADFGDQQIGGSTSHPSNSYYYSNSYSQTSVTNGNSFGNISAGTGLSGASLSDLTTDSILPYSLNLTGGQFDSLGMRLDIDFSLAALQVARAPLPASALLFGSGLGGLGLLSRMRRRKTKADDKA